MFGMEDNQDSIVTDHQQALRICEKYIQDLYDSEKILQLKQKRNWMKMTKDLLYLKVKDKRRKKATGDDNISVDLLKELGDSGLKIMTALVNKIYMNGDWLRIS